MNEANEANDLFGCLALWSVEKMMERLCDGDSYKFKFLLLIALTYVRIYIHALVFGGCFSI